MSYFIEGIEYNSDTRKFEVRLKDLGGKTITVDLEDITPPSNRLVSFTTTISCLSIEMSGWLVMDEDDNLWLFPGIDNIPEKKDKEWVGSNPIHITEFTGTAYKNLLKTTPQFLKLKQSYD